MIIGLLWRAARDAGTCTTRSARVPSWSWASINGGVTYSPLLMGGAYTARIHMSPLVDILDVSDPTTSEDHPNRVKLGQSLSLSGVIWEVTRVENEESRLALVDNGLPVAHSIRDFFSDFRGFNRPDREFLVCLPACVDHGWHPGIQESGELRKALWRRSLETGIDEYEQFNVIYCWILEAIEGNQGTYSRVGLCRLGYHKTIEVSKMALFGERRSITII